MNPLLEKLAEQAWDETAVSPDFGHPVTFAERFAELIIAQCITVCNSRVGNSDYNTGRLHCASDIKECFELQQQKR